MKATLFLFGILFAFPGCKYPEQQASSSKEFAASTVSPNFAIVSGYSSDDSQTAGISSDNYNWLNILQRKGMGDAVIAYSNKSASVSGLKEAFKKVGTELLPDSTVTFTFSGQRQGSELTLSDGTTTVESLVKIMQSAAKKTKLNEVRFYVLTDTVDSKKPDSAATKFVSKSVLSLFSYAIEFSARSDKKSASGRLATEFAGALSQINKSNNPTLGDFLNKVSSRIKKVGGSSVFVESKPDSGILNQPILSSIEAKPTQSVGNSSSNSSSGSDVQTIIQLLQQSFAQLQPPFNPQQPVNFPPEPLNQTVQPQAQPQVQPQPQNTLNNGIPPSGVSPSGTTDVTQYSLSFCGPCKAEAEQIAKDPRFTGANPQCTNKILVVDGKLEEWKALVGQDPFIVQHSMIGKDPQNRSSYPQFDSNKPGCGR
jgi:hypothetical protein